MVDYVQQFAKKMYEVAGKSAKDVCGKNRCDAGRIICLANMAQRACRQNFETIYGIKDEYSELENK